MITRRHLNDEEDRCAYHEIIHQRGSIVSELRRYLCRELLIRIRFSNMRRLFGMVVMLPSSYAAKRQKRD